MIFLLALSIGFVAGLRALTAPAFASWAAYLGWLDATQSPFAFFDRLPTAVVLSVLAIAELVADQHPRTPSRKVPVQFGTRVVTGALSGGVIGASGGALVLGALLGAVGAVLGTLAGAAARARVAAYFQNDRTAGFLESAFAVTSAFVIVVNVA